MQSQKRLLDDIARVTTGALGTLQGVKQELESYFHQQFDKLIGSKVLIGREEFEVVKAMAAKARAENERLAARVAELEKAVKPKRTQAKPKAQAKPKTKVQTKSKPKPTAKPKAGTKPKTPAKRKAAAKPAMASAPA